MQNYYVAYLVAYKVTELSIASGLLLVGCRVVYSHRRQSTKVFATAKKIEINNNNNKELFFVSSIWFLLIVI